MQESGATPGFLACSGDCKVVLKYSENRGAGAALSRQVRFIQAFGPKRPFHAFLRAVLLRTDLASVALHGVC